MLAKLEYHSLVKRLNGATVADLASAILVLGVCALLASTATAQINGAPPSVTSPGFGGNAGSVRGVAPSVTSLGPRGYTPGRSSTPLFGNPDVNLNSHHHPHSG